MSKSFPRTALAFISCQYSSVARRRGRYLLRYPESWRRFIHGASGASWKPHSCHTPLTEWATDVLGSQRMPRIRNCCLKPDRHCRSSSPIQLRTMSVPTGTFSLDLLSQNSGLFSRWKHPPHCDSWCQFVETAMLQGGACHWWWHELGYYKLNY